MNGRARLLLSALALLVPAIALGGVADAGGSEGSRVLYAGLGLISYDLGRLSDSTAGDTSIASSIYVPLEVVGRIPLGSPEWKFSPFLAFTPIGHGSPDGGETGTLWTFAARFSRTISVPEMPPI